MGRLIDSSVAALHRNDIAIGGGWGREEAGAKHLLLSYPLT